MNAALPAHLSHIDAEVWPAVATLPGDGARGAVLRRVGARRAEASFAAACRNAGLILDPNNDPDLIVLHEELFLRIADSGWLGFAEGYLAGEWVAEDLPRVLAALIGIGYQPVPMPVISGRRQAASGPEGELPRELLDLYAGSDLLTCPGRFASGVSTTVREPEPFGGRKRAVGFVDVTNVDAPVRPDRADLPGAQARAAEALLDAAGVGPGAYVLEFPASGAGLARLAAERGATIDVLSRDPAFTASIEDSLAKREVDRRAVQVRDVQRAIPTREDWRGRYDAVVSLNKLPEVGHAAAMFRAIDRMLSATGRAAVQTLVATNAMTKSGRGALAPLRDYIWPGLELNTIAELHEVVNRTTGLTIVAREHSGSHAADTARLQLEVFAAREREAAASGFDAVFRRLWNYQLALVQALCELGEIDAVTMTLAHRPRRLEAQA